MKVEKKKAAHFLLVPELAGSPPNDAIVSALLNLGYEVDLFSPGDRVSVDRHGDNVRYRQVQYCRSWIAKNILSSRWFGYDLFSGTSEDPMAIVGLLSSMYRKPSFCLADEIKSGSYRGDAPEYWKRLCRFGMRKARFNIVNDEARKSLQKEYANLEKNADVIVYPGCFKDPPLVVDTDAQRNLWNIPASALVLSCSGWFNMTGGADWLINVVGRDKSLFLVLQPMKLDEMTNFLLHQIRGNKRIYIEGKRLGWRDAWASMGGVDIGIVIYRNTAPQFQHMGVSSNKLCMYLAMGVPVIALKQKSFEFIEEYECGVLVETEDQFIAAIETVRANLNSMKTNALKCAEKYIDTSGRYGVLKARLSKLS